MIATRSLSLAMLPLMAPVAAFAQDGGHMSHGSHTAMESTMESTGEAEAETPEAPPVDHSRHAGHAPPAGPQGESPPKRDADVRALEGPAHAADLYWDEEEMAEARAQVIRSHGALLVSRFSIDRLEARIGDGADSYVWDAEYRVGGDIDGLVLSTEGAGLIDGDVRHGEAQAVWRHAINPWFDLQAGLRQDFGEESDRTHLVLGAEGLLPYWIETNARIFVSTEGDIAARLEAEHDVRISRSLILQPRAELDLAIHDAGAPDEGSHVSLGLRLRYRASALVQPYVGFDWSSELGGDGQDNLAARRVPDAAVLVGLKAMF